jgi:hypothetical protein
VLSVTETGSLELIGPIDAFSYPTICHPVIGASGETDDATDDVTDNVTDNVIGQPRLSISFGI